MFPSKKEWGKWGIINKYSVIGFFITVIMALVTLYTIAYPNGFVWNKYRDPNIHYVADKNRVSRGDFLGKAINEILPNEHLKERPRNPIPKTYFIDIQNEYKYAKQIYFSRSKGIVSSRPRFHPEEEIRRKEVIVILSNVICLARNGSTTIPNSCANSFKGKEIYFQDIKDSKLEKLAGFRPYASHLLSLGIIKPSNVFQPNSPISLEDANYIISKGAGVSHSTF